MSSYRRVSLLMRVDGGCRGRGIMVLRKPCHPALTLHGRDVDTGMVGAGTDRGLGICVDQTGAAFRRPLGRALLADHQRQAERSGRLTPSLHPVPHRAAVDR